ncbi:MAG: endolytic transglycosylase MltG [Patescibacteria group bacterium]|nr:endolytic transglycosylase MltG [Patescibacteria group bacterium]
MFLLNFFLKFINFVKKYLGIIVFIFFTLFLIYFLFNIFKPKSFVSNYQFFEIKKGENIFNVSQKLYNQNLINSRLSFNLLGILTGKALRLQIGTYKLNSNLNLWQILNFISSGQGREVSISILPGHTIYDIDEVLAKNNILQKGELIYYAKKNNLEGKLMPDNYMFFYNSKIEDVVNKILDNFNKKMWPLLIQSNNPTSTLIIASMLEKEAPFFEDQKIITGIILNRLKLNMFLNIDATICYAKILLNEFPINCLPITALDLKINSAYNTYTNKGLPPGPISNPSISAVQAALNPVQTDYLYYLSDPKTKKTIFSKTLEEHNKNILKYLK